MSRVPHRLLLASAGTGKTFRLTGHFLELLFAGVEPERVLATTFTRKAAGEILDRLLGRLVEAAESPTELAALAAHLDRPELCAADCVALLARLARGLDRFQVRTLDSFFVHLARLFALDLALPPGWTIVDEREDAELQSEAVARVLAASRPEERLELLRRLQQQGASRSVHEALLRIVDQFRGAFLESEASAWEWLAAPAGPSPGELAEALERLAELPLPLTAKGTPLKHWATARDRALLCAEAGDWEGLLELTLVQKVVAGEEQFAKKPIDAQARQVLEVLILRARAELIGRLADKNAATHRFLEHFEEAYQELKRERGAYRFDDLPVALAPGGAAGARPFDERQLDLWFRLDGRLDHVLLDEFQDTAPLQWRILEPIAGEVLADGTGERSFFCVGDVKQSIYEWRRGEPRLLTGLPARYSVLAPESMATSYRSSRVVLDTVNRVFGDVDSSPVFAAEERAHLGAAAERWRAAFQDHAAARELPGAALLIEAEPAAEGERAQDPVLRKAVERVADLAISAPDASVAILLRRNRHVPRLIYALRQRGVRASQEGGNPLTDSEAVLAFLSLLHLADHPGDTAAAFHVASTPFGPALGLVQDVPDVTRQQLAREVRGRLMHQGYGPFAASFMEALERGGAWSAWDLKRFAQLVDLAHAFDERATLRPVDFVEHVRRERVEERSAARVRVMTVHAAKGLEFDAVVLPELDERLLGSGETLLTRRPDPYGPIATVSGAPRKILGQLDPELRELRAEVRGRAMEESLCVLYVAMTRAARRLEMIVRHREPEKVEDPKLDYASLLRLALAPGEEADGGLLWRHAESDEAWAPRAAPVPEAASPRQRAQPAPRLAHGGAPRALPAHSPSAEEHACAGARELLRPRSPGATARGSLVHRWLEELEWIEDFTLDDAALLALGAELEPDAAARRAALEPLRAALQEQRVRAALSRAERDPELELEVQRERRFSITLDDGGGESLWTGAFDRLVLERRAGRVVGCEVVDYKSDRVAAEALDQRVAFYRPQLAAYRRIAATIAGLPPEDVRARLIFLHPRAVVDVPHDAPRS